MPELLAYTPGGKERMMSELRRVLELSDEELNDLVPDRELREITWEYIFPQSEAMRLLMEGD